MLFRIMKLYSFRDIPDSAVKSRKYLIRIYSPRRNLAITFCMRLLPCLQPSSIRRLAAPWSTDLHCSLSPAALRSIPVLSPLDVFMFSIHEIFGFLLVLFPGSVHWVISFSKQAEQLPLLLMMWPKYLIILAVTVANNVLVTPAFSKTHSFLRFAVHDTLNICIRQTGLLRVS